MTSKTLRFFQLMALLLLTVIGVSMGGISASAAATNDPAAPPLERPVVDVTNTLSSQQVDEIAAAINAGRAIDGRQTGVLIVDTTGRDSIEAYSIRIARDWGIGENGKDNGILLVVAVDDKSLRIEVGRGLEGDIPDALARRIGDNLMVPHMKNGDVYRAVLAGAEAVQAEGDRMAAATEDTGTVPPWLIIVGIFILSVVIASGGGSQRRGHAARSRSASSSSKNFGGSFGGGSFGGGGSSSRW